ncbi:MAG TPA: hypothetical protein VET65_11465 [Candidatus Limnocylindrales bacterium]|nr:hypothetical protein [Candidatus Limnocylindrales bacterium]
MPARRAAPRKAHKRNLVEQVAEEIESHLLAAGQVATGTSSAEVNLLAAAMEAVEGPPPAADEPAQRKRRRPARRRAKRPRA